MKELFCDPAPRWWIVSGLYSVACFCGAYLILEKGGHHVPVILAVTGFLIPFIRFAFLQKLKKDREESLES